MATAIYSMGVGVAPTLAPLVGGYVSEEISWRWVFFILLPLAVVALIGVLAFIKPDPPRRERAKLDWTGFLSHRQGGAPGVDRPRRRRRLRAAHVGPGRA